MVQIYLIQRVRQLFYIYLQVDKLLFWETMAYLDQINAQSQSDTSNEGEVSKVEIGSTQAAESSDAITEKLNEEEVTEAVKEEKVEEEVAETAEVEEEELAEEKRVAPDFNKMSLEEILLYFKEMLERSDHHEIYRDGEAIRASFYKQLKREKGAATVEEESTKEEQEVDESAVDVEPSSSPFLEIEREFKELLRRYREKRRYLRELLEREKEQNLADKLHIIEELKELLEKQEDLQHTFPNFRELQNRWRSIGAVPQSENRRLWETYQFHTERFYDYVKINNELRDLDLKKNLEQKLRLCEKAEALLEEKLIVPAFNKLQKYHQAWREIGPVPREEREPVWERFKAATSIINRRQQAYFEGLKEQQKENLEKKRALCEKAEAIANQEGEKEWNKLTKEMQSLQQEWRGIGYTSKKDNQKIYDRFRAACDKFYNDKRDYYAQFKKVMEENLKKKIELCEAAEAMQESEEWNKTTNDLIELQKNWKEIGPVTRKQSDIVWKRFRAACDRFFERKSAHYSSKGKNYRENLASKLAIIKEVKNYKVDSSSTDNSAIYSDFIARFDAIGFVPMDKKDEVQREFKEALEVKFPEIKESEHQFHLQRFSKHITRIKESDRGDRAVKHERDRLIQQLRKLEQEIATWENNIGFFAKSKSADNIINDFKSKIASAKEEVTAIEEKIKLIDKQYQ